MQLVVDCMQVSVTFNSTLVYILLVCFQVLALESGLRFQGVQAFLSAYWLDWSLTRNSLWRNCRVNWIECPQRIKRCRDRDRTSTSRLELEQGNTFTIRTRQDVHNWSSKQESTHLLLWMTHCILHRNSRHPERRLTWNTVHPGTSSQRARTADSSRQQKKCFWILCSCGVFGFKQKTSAS